MPHRACVESGILRYLKKVCLENSKDLEMLKTMEMMKKCEEMLQIHLATTNVGCTLNTDANSVLSMVVIDVKGVHEWQRITKGYDGRVNSVKDNRIKKRAMTWHVSWGCSGWSWHRYDQHVVPHALDTSPSKFDESKTPKKFIRTFLKCPPNAVFV